jgi:hypothetical protein
VVVNSLDEALPGAEISFGGLHGSMAEQQLHLFEIATRQISLISRSASYV